MFPRQRDRPRHGSFRSPLAYRNRTVLENDGKAHGYDACFLKELDQKHTCPVCLTAMNDPVQTKCGHRFCCSCLRRVCGSRRYFKCPVDNTWLDSQVDLFEDNAMKREIMSLEVKCCEESCDWKGELRKLQFHESSCELMVVECNNKCDTKVKRSLLPDHYPSCPMRKVDCQHCEEKICFANMTKHQLLQCMKFPVNCAVCGQTEIMREDIPKHIDMVNGDCPLVVTTCPLSALGCTFQDKRKNMPAHHSSSALHHMLLMVNKLAEQDRVISQQEHKLSSQGQALVFAKENIKNLVKECDSLKKKWKGVQCCQ